MLMLLECATYADNKKCEGWDICKLNKHMTKAVWITESNDERRLQKKIFHCSSTKNEGAPKIETQIQERN